MASRLVSLGAALAVVGVTAALVVVPPARADGDPASDVLYGASLFPSYNSGISAANLETLQATLDAANKAGYEIRVALIAKPDDLGSVTALWGNPRQYARFLGTELGIVYKKPLLVVMPSGIGFYHANRDTATAYAALKTVQTGTGDQLARAAIDSVLILSRQAGHPVNPHTIVASSSSTSRTITPHTIVASSSSTSRTILFIGIGTAVVIVSGLVALVLVWRRRHS